MFDIGWTELLVIGVVALIVVGPKDLPGMFRTLGRFTAKARTMAREFSRAMEDAADESGVGDIAKDLKSMTSVKNLGLDKIKDAATKFEDWDPMSKSTKPKKPKKTEPLTKERAEVAKKIRDAGAKKATERLAREAAEAKSAASTPKSTAKTKPAAKKKPATKSTEKPAKPAAAKAKAAPRKATAKKPAAKKPAAKKPVSKKPVSKKTAKGAAE